jgi:23S rRNA (pseudouridine1915-N3)-methyltransferase
MKAGPLADLAATYMRRMTSPVKVIEVDGKPGLSGATLKQAEAEAIRGKLSDDSVVVALDERGKSMSSPELAAWIGARQGEAVQHIVFVIGGADGLDDTLRNEARLVLGFGQLTWPHMLARVMLLEQLYRAQQILAGHPYHRE